MQEQTHQLNSARRACMPLLRAMLLPTAAFGLWLGVLRPALACPQASAVVPAPSPNAQPKVVKPDLNPLEQMERCVTAIVGQAQNAVVSIESHPAQARISLPKVLPSFPDSPDSKQNAGKRAESQKALEEAKKAMKELGAVHMVFAPPVTGSGFLVEGGFVITTAEVTEGMRDIWVVTATGARLKVDWVNRASRSNVAVLKIAGDPSGPTLHWGDSDDVQPGCFALTIGNQAGFANSVTFGLVSGINRSGQSRARRYENLIQFQGAVGNDSSGGPLLNARGEVVGMIVAAPANAISRPFWRNRGDNREPRSQQEDRSDQNSKGRRMRAESTRQNENENTTEKTDKDKKDGESDSSEDGNEGADDTMPAGFPPPGVFPFGGISNTGFAIPSNELKRIAIALMERKPVIARMGWLGVFLEDDEKAAPPEGALIKAIPIGGPADKAGLLPGDVVTAVDGQLLRSPRDLGKKAAEAGVGRVLQLDVRRGVMTLHLPLTIEERPPDTSIDKLPVRQSPSPSQSSEWQAHHAPCSSV